MEPIPEEDCLKRRPAHHSLDVCSSQYVAFCSSQSKVRPDFRERHTLN